MAKIIMIGNYKGGSGKTQTAVELSHWLSWHRQRVLALDIDHQANFTKILSKDEITGKRTLPEILIAGDTISRSDITTCMINPLGGGIDFIESSLVAGRIEKRLSDDTPKEYVLKDALETIQDDYDYIIIDTPPSAELVFIFSLIASDYLLITSQPAIFSAEGVYKLFPVIEAAQRQPRMNPELKVMGILITQYEDTKDARKTVSELQENYGNLVLDPVIRKSTKVKEANRKYMAVQAYAPQSTSARDYQQVFSSLFPEI